MSVYHTMSTNDGGSLKLTLNMGAVYELSKKRKDLADEYFRMQRELSKKKDELTELDMARFLYIAYVCAHLKDETGLLSYEEFLETMTESREEMSKVFMELYGIKKKPGSQMPSGKQHQKKRKK